MNANAALYEAYKEACREPVAALLKSLTEEQRATAHLLLVVDPLGVSRFTKLLSYLDYKSPAPAERRNLLLSMFAPEQRRFIEDIILRCHQVDLAFALKAAINGEVPAGTALAGNEVAPDSAA